MSRFLSLLLILSTLFVSSCYKIRGDGTENPWEKLDFSTEIPIRAMHASPLELLAVSDNQLYRIGVDNEVIEKRSFPLPAAFFGRPAISDFMFIRLVRTFTTDQLVQIHLVRNPDEVYEFNVGDLEAGPGESFELEGESRDPGAFNADGSQFMLPMRVITADKRYYAFFLLDIELDPTKSNFISVTVNKRIDLDDLPGDPGNLNNIKFLNGNYYVTSRNGGFRITPQGETLTAFNDWTWDTFEKDNRLYITNFNDFEFYSSLDNGLSWERVGEPSEIKMALNVNDQIFSQKAIGFPFTLADEKLKEVDELLLNEDFPEDLAAYSDLVYFFGNYYMTVQKEIFFVKEIDIKED